MPLFRVTYKNEFGDQIVDEFGAGTIERAAARVRLELGRRREFVLVRIHGDVEPPPALKKTWGLRD